MGGCDVQRSDECAPLNMVAALTFELAGPVSCESRSPAVN
jgi:hypothetical protein